MSELIRDGACTLHHPRLISPSPSLHALFSLLLSTIDSISLPFHFTIPSEYSPSALLLSTIDSVSLSFHFFVPSALASMTDHSGHTMNMDDSMMSESASTSFCGGMDPMIMYMSGTILYCELPQTSDHAAQTHSFPLPISFFYRISVWIGG
jgi:hypothetical protein